MTNEEVDAYKEELEGIRVKGKGCPKPIKSWAQCGVTKKELDVLKKLGYEKPTPIQCQAIPAIMSGRDLIGIAKTGSGKTLAFLLPMFRHILDQPPLTDGDGPIALIMTPTRELCMQIGRDSKKFTKSLNLSHVCVYGGTGISEQIAELKRGAEIIVCTPGRMIDMLAANSGRVTNLRRVTYVVLDEADRMFDMGFEPQVLFAHFDLTVLLVLGNYYTSNRCAFSGDEDNGKRQAGSSDSPLQCNVPKANGGTSQKNTYSSRRGASWRAIGRLQGSRATRRSAGGRSEILQAVGNPRPLSRQGFDNCVCR